MNHGSHYWYHIMISKRLNRLIKYFTYIFIILFISSCSLKEQQIKKYPVSSKTIESSPVLKNQKPATIDQEINHQKWPFNSKFLKNQLIQLLNDWGEPAFAIDESLIQHVSYFYKYYSVISHKRSNRAIIRGRKYLPEIIKIFDRYRLPEDVAFALPFVESSFHAKARSGVGAVGMFQFMKQTARDYGLIVNSKKDERINIYKSADACARYLRNNRNVFASTVLSLGSYHHGTGKVSQVLLSAANADQRSFQAIFNNKRLGKYSKEYIPQCLSAAIIYRVLKKMNLQLIPEMSITQRRLSKAVLVDTLQNQYSNLFALNPDLIMAKQIYPYINTHGYIQIVKMSVDDLPKQFNVNIASDTSKPVTPVPIKKSLSKKSYQKFSWPKNPAVTSAGNSRVKGRKKFIRYVFQTCNDLEVLLQIFGKNEQEIKNIRENSYLKKRHPQAGDVIRIDNLSPTTQKLGGQGILCGKKVSIFTKNHETIKDVTYRAISLIQESCNNSEWELGTNISPELVYYWNCDILGNISSATQLIPNIPVVIYSDYLPYQSPKNSRNRLSNGRQKEHGKSSFAVKRKTGTKYISYDIQNHNILEDNLIRNISAIFRLSPNELVKWNPWLVKLGTNPRRWSKKQKTIVIKNCPDSIQKFGNPGIVCNKGSKGEDTRLNMLKGEILSQAALRAKKMVQSCGGKGKGISPKNILYWNADNLQAAGVRGLKDRSQKTIKLTIYSDFY